MGDIALVFGGIVTLLGLADLLFRPGAIRFRQGQNRIDISLGSFCFRWLEEANRFRCVGRSLAGGCDAVGRRMRLPRKSVEVGRIDRLRLEAATIGEGSCFRRRRVDSCAGNIDEVECGNLDVEPRSSHRVAGLHASNLPSGSSGFCLAGPAALPSGSPQRARGGQEMREAVGVVQGRRAPPSQREAHGWSASCRHRCSKTGWLGRQCSAGCCSDGFPRHPFRRQCDATTCAVDAHCSAFPEVVLALDRVIASFGAELTRC
jgi:hypothetical protein